MTVVWSTARNDVFDPTKHVFHTIRRPCRKTFKVENCMKRNKNYLFIPGLLLLCIFCFSGNVSAEDKDISVRAWATVSPFLSGQAGSGSGAPDYGDAFDTGFGGGAEAAWRFADRFSLLAGIGYEYYGGSTYEGISFDDRKIMPVYLGGKFHFLTGRKGWNPYVRAEIGAARLSSVDISVGDHKSEYWSSSWEFLFAAGAGVEYRFNQIGAFLEIKARYMNKPEPEMGSLSEADNSWTVPVVFGVAYYF